MLVYTIWDILWVIVLVGIVTIVGFILIMYRISEIIYDIFNKRRRKND